MVRRRPVGTLNVPGAGLGGTGGQPAVEIDRRLAELEARIRAG